MTSPAILSIKTLHEGWGKLLLATIRLAGGAVIRREIEHHGDAVCVLPYDPERRVAMIVRQFRAPVFQATGESEMLEAPAGLLDEDDPQACARREAIEEVGLTLEDLQPIVTGWSMPGISTERLHLFLAPYGQASRTHPGGGLDAEQENITPEEWPLAELGRRADAGLLTDLKTLLLVTTLRARRPDLFV